MSFPPRFKTESYLFAHSFSLIYSLVYFLFANFLFVLAFGNSLLFGLESSEIDESLGSPGFVWTVDFGGWELSTESVFGDGSSVLNQTIEPTNTISTTVPGGTNIQFWVKLDSEGGFISPSGRGLEIDLPGAFPSSIRSSKVDEWFPVRFRLHEEGDHTLTIRSRSREWVYLDAMTVVPHRGLNFEAINGDVSFFPEKESYSAGEEVTLTAAPNPGYRFAYWETEWGRVEDEVVTFVVEQDGPLYRAVFEKNVELASLAFSTGGSRAWHETEEGIIIAGHFDADHYARTTIEGPVSVSLSGRFGVDGFYWAGGELRALVNGQLIDSFDDHNVTENYFDFTIPIDSGSHEFKLEFEAEDHQITHVEITSFEIVSGHTITIDQQANGKVVVSPDKDLYDPGELVTITAVPDDGYRFAGWHGSANLVLQPQSESLSFNIQNNWELTAYFFQDKSGDLKLFTGGDVPWYEYDTTQGGDGLFSLQNGNDDFQTQTSFESWLFAEVEGPGILSFWLDRDEEYPDFLQIDGIWQDLIPIEDIVRIRNHVDYFEVPISKGKHTVRWLGDSFFDSYIKEPYFLGGNKVDVLHKEWVTVVPKKQEYESGEVVTITASEEPGRRFLRWAGDVESIENPLELVVDGPYKVEPKYIEDPFLSQFRWRTGGGGGGFFIDEPGIASSDTWYCAPGYDWPVTWLEVDLEGPGVLSYSKDLTIYDSNILRFYVDGELTELQHPNTRGPYTEIVGIPAGIHTLRWERDSGALRLFDFEYNSGYSIATVPSWRGEVYVTPEKDIYEKGETFSLEANPHEGYKFLTWLGDIESTDNPYIGLLDTSIRVKALFGDSVTFQEDLWWTSGENSWVEGTLPESETPAMLISGLGVNDSSWAERKFQGPAVLRFEAYRNCDTFEFYINDVLQEGHIPYGWTTQEVLLEEGVHTVRIVASGYRSGAELGSAGITSFELLQGYLFRINDSPYGTISSSTGNGVFSVNTPTGMTLESGEGYQFIKWSQWDGGTEFPQEYRINEHTDLYPLFAPNTIVDGVEITDLSPVGSWGWTNFDPGIGDVLINDNFKQESTWIELEVNGPGLFSFVYEFSHPTLQFTDPIIYVDDQFFSSIRSARRDDTYKEVFIPLLEGIHQIRIIVGGSEYYSRHLGLRDIKIRNSVFQRLSGESEGLIAVGHGFTITENTDDVIEGASSLDFVSPASEDNVLCLFYETFQEVQTFLKFSTKTIAGEFLGGDSRTQDWRDMNFREGWEEVIRSFEVPMENSRNSFLWIIVPGEEGAHTRLDGFLLKPTYRGREVFSLGRVAYEPERTFFGLGETVTATATPNQGNVFLGWTGSVESEDPEITFQVTAEEFPSPMFVQEFTASDIVWITEGAGWWDLQGDILKTENNTLEAHSLEAVIQGPGRLPIQHIFNEREDSSKTTMGRFFILVNGQVIFSDDDPQGLVIERNLYFGPGEHRLKFVLENQGQDNALMKTVTLDLYTQPFEPGIFVELFDGGSGLTIVPEKEVYELGEEISITLDHSEDLVFEGWEGSLSGREKDLTLKLEDHVFGYPIFMKSISFAGLEFETSAIKPWQFFEPNELVSSDPFDGDFLPSNLRTTVTGPGVLRFGYRDYFQNFGGSPVWIELRLDGALVQGYPVRSRHYRDVQLTVPEGEHTIEWLLKENPAFGFSYGTSRENRIILGRFSYTSLMDPDTNSILSWLSFFDSNLNILQDPFWADQDLDDDGVMALDELIFGGNPQEYDPVFFEQGYVLGDGETVSPYFNFSRNKLMGDDVMFVQVTSNLKDWETLVPEEYSMEVLFENEVQEVLSIEILPNDGEQRFYRFVYF